jgi:methionyl-tRNA synthetase
MYVWIDALCNYLTSIGYPDTNNKNFKKYWPGLHVVGKDILRFHSVYWPAFLMAADLEPPSRVFAHGWWTNEGKKISKSLGNIIDPYEVVLNYGLDQIRFFLFREVPFGNDGDFSKESIAQRINADLSNNFGNLVQRICSFVNKNCNSTVSNFVNFNEEDNKLITISINKFDKYKQYMNEQNIDKSLKVVFELLTETNIYIDKQAPWILKKTNLERMKVVLFVVLEIIRRTSLLLFPVIPGSCEKVFSILNVEKKDITLNNYQTIPSEPYSINESFPVFPRIDIDD